MTNFRNYSRIPNARDKAYELFQEGIINERAMLEACLQYMSCDDISDMLHANEFIWEDDDED